MTTEGDRNIGHVRRGLVSAAVTVAVVTGGAGIAVAALTATDPDARDIPRIETSRPLRAISEEPTTAVSPSSIPVSPPPPAAGSSGTPAAPAAPSHPEVGTDAGREPDEDHEFEDGDRHDEDEDREVVSPPVREKDGEDEDKERESDDEKDKDAERS